MGGCDGNLKTIPLLLDGWSVDQIEQKLAGITCGRRGTSCSDQLAKADLYKILREIMEKL